MKLKLSTLATGVAVTVIGGLVLRQITGGGFSFGRAQPASYLPAATRADPTATLAAYSRPLTQPAVYRPRGNASPTAPIFDPRLVDISSVSNNGTLFSVY